MATDEGTHPGSVFRMQFCYVHDGLGGNNIKSRAERNEIYYNWIEGAYYHELELIGPDLSGGTTANEGTAREDSDVVGNVFRKTGSNPAFFVTRVGGDGNAQTNGRYRFVNNTIIVASTSAVFRLFDGLESIEMHNNVIYRAGGGPVNLTDTSSVVWATGSAVIAGVNNWIGTGSTNVPSQWTGTLTGTDPGLVAQVTDLRPAATSPLVNAGMNTPATIAGHPFPSPLATPAFVPSPALLAVGAAVVRPTIGTIDIGAYEFGTSSGGGARHCGNQRRHWRRQRRRAWRVKRLGGRNRHCRSLRNRRHVGRRWRRRPRPERPRHRRLFLRDHGAGSPSVQRRPVWRIRRGRRLPAAPRAGPQG